MVTGSVPGFTFAIVDEAEFSAPTIQKQPMSGTTSRDEAASRILEAAEAADAFDELFLFELVRRAGHDVDLDTAGVGADEVKVAAAPAQGNGHAVTEKV